MRSRSRNLIEHFCLAIAVLWPGILLATTDCGSQLFAAVVINYGVGTLLGLSLYIYRQLGH